MIKMIIVLALHSFLFTESENCGMHTITPPKKKRGYACRINAIKLHFVIDSLKSRMVMRC